jgi:hypothetical protein
MIQTTINKQPVIIRLSLSFVKQEEDIEEILTSVKSLQEKLLLFLNDCFVYNHPTIGLIVIQVQEGQAVIDVRVLRVIKHKNVI